MVLLNTTHLPHPTLYPNETWGNCDNYIYEATAKDQSSYYFNFMTSTVKLQPVGGENCASQKTRVLDPKTRSLIALFNHCVRCENIYRRRWMIVALAERWWQAGNGGTRKRKPVPVPFCVPQIPSGLVWLWIGSRRCVSARSVSRPSGVGCDRNIQIIKPTICTNVSF